MYVRGVWCGEVGIGEVVVVVVVVIRREGTFAGRQKADTGSFHTMVNFFLGRANWRAGFDGLMIEAQSVAAGHLLCGGTCFARLGNMWVSGREGREGT